MGMSDARMDEFGYQTVVDPRLCSKEAGHVASKVPIMLPLRGPMGALA